VVILPEARSDIAVTVVRANAKLPLRVSRVGDRVVVDGGLPCDRTAAARRSARGG